MKRIVLVLALVLCLVLVGVMAAPAMAAPANPAAGSKLLVNVTYKVTNDEDSGNVGYWALDNYNRQLQVWQQPDGTFFVKGSYEGKWQTYAGALSPGAGLVQKNDAQGTLEGGYAATFAFSGTFNPNSLKTNGNIPALDFGGTKADVLLGSYGAGQTGPTTVTSVLGLYFPGYSGFTYLNWGWTYKYQNQRWVNFDTGTTGDIVIP